MTSRVQPSTLQTFNNDLVKNLERLREQREDLDKEIEHGQTRQNELQNHMLVLQQQLDETTQSLIKASQSSQTVLDFLLTWPFFSNIETVFA
ncbi:hypothetical protein DFS34DRAFT_652475 [Phlyctochytrium arcticum]|nr:hypothetical protein DFS34DRAFT_652475 [Phlyctochytrium arcticum]